MCYVIQTSALLCTVLPAHFNPLPQILVCMACKGLNFDPHTTLQSVSSSYFPSFTIQPLGYHKSPWGSQNDSFLIYKMMPETNSINRIALGFQEPCKFIPEMRTECPFTEGNTFLLGQRVPWLRECCLNCIHCLTRVTVTVIQSSLAPFFRINTVSPLQGSIPTQ